MLFVTFCLSNYFLEIISVKGGEVQSSHKKNEVFESFDQKAKKRFS